MIFWIFFSYFVSHSWGIPMMKIQASLIFLSGRTCTIGGWLNTFLPHCIYTCVYIYTHTHYNCWPLANLSFNALMDSGTKEFLKGLSLHFPREEVGTQSEGHEWDLKLFLSLSSNCFFKKSLRCGMLLNSHNCHGSLC